MSELAREDCANCGGSGEITKAVAGHSGLVPCPDCDNVPEHSIPSEIPDDPEGRVEEIEQELEKIQAREEHWGDLRELLRSAKDNLGEVSKADIVPEDAKVRLAHYSSEIAQELHGMNVGQGLRYDKQQLRTERRKLQRYLEYREAGDE